MCVWCVHVCVCVYIRVCCVFTCVRVNVRVSCVFCVYVYTRVYCVYVVCSCMYVDTRVCVVCLCACVRVKERRLRDRHTTSVVSYEVEMVHRGFLPLTEDILVVCY